MSRQLAFPAVRRLLVAVQLTLLLAAPAAAQDTAVVFVHGIMSNGSVWDNAVGTLRQQLRINPLQPSLDWLQTEAVQANQLASFLNSHPATSDPNQRMPFVGHSNGGLASREYSRTGGRLRQIATVATPHRGAPLANNWINYNTIHYGQYVVNVLYRPLDFYHAYDPESPLVIDLAYYAMYPMAWLANNLDSLMCPVAGLCIVWNGANYVAAPVVFELADSSQATARLNANTNLSREAAAIGHRVGLWTEAHPFGALFDLTTDSPGDWITARDIAFTAYLTGYQYYRDHWDPYLSAYSWLWVSGAAALLDMDADWQALTGTLVQYYRLLDPDYGYFYTFLDALPSDGVVPASSAEYPGGSRTAQIPGNLAHTKQTQSFAVRAALFGVLSGDFGIPLRETPPPPPSHWAQIQGPHAIRPWYSCYWYVSTNVPNASYEWSVDGISVGSGADLYYSAQSSFTLSVQVWNSDGDGASASRYIDVSYENGECAIS